MCRTKFIYLLGILLTITIPGYTKDLEVYVIKPPEIVPPGVEQIAIAEKRHQKPADLLLN